MTRFRSMAQNTRTAGSARQGDTPLSKETSR